MRKPLVHLLVAIVGISPFLCARTVLSQTLDIKATVIADDFLRVSASSRSDARRVVRKGVALKVRPAAGGWYFGCQVGHPECGYIHGNSIRLVKSPDLVDGDLPSFSNVIEVPPVKPPKVSTSVASTSRGKNNYCPPPRFCPDIGDVYESLFEYEPKARKGKFEKTSEWEKRRSQILNDISLKDGKKGADQVTFLYEVGTGFLTQKEETYDADTERWTFPLDTLSFGSSVCVPVMSEKTGGLYCLIVSDKIRLSIELRIAMIPSVAATHNGKLRLGLVGHLQSADLWRPTSPQAASTVVSEGVFFNLNEILGINPKTGETWKAEYEKAEPSSKLENTESSTNAAGSKMVTSTAEELVRQIFQVLADAIERNDYSEFRKLLSKSTQSISTDEKLATEFRILAKYRSISIDELRSTKNAKPRFVEEPKQFTAGSPNIITAKGIYEGVLNKSFDFMFAQEDGKWKLFFYRVAIDELRSNDPPDLTQKANHIETIPTVETFKKNPIEPTEAESLARETFKNIALGLEKKSFTDLHRQLATPFKSKLTPAVISRGFDAFTKERKSYSALFKSIADAGYFAGAPSLVLSQQFDKYQGIEVLSLSGSQFTTIKRGLLKIAYPVSVTYKFYFMPEDGGYRLVDCIVNVQ